MFPLRSPFFGGDRTTLQASLSLKRRLNLQLFDHFFQYVVGLIALRFGVLDFLSQCVELGFLLVQLPGVVLQQRFFLRAAAQRFHVFAQPALILNDAVDVFLAVLQPFRPS